MELMPGYKQTEVGVIPDDWETKTLLELAEGKKELFDDGDWIEAEHITTKGVRLIQTGNIGIGKFIEKDERKYIYEASFVSLRCKELKQGDLLICRLAEPAGRSCVLEDIGEGKIVTSVDVTIFRPPSEIADRYFLSQVFSTSEWFKSVNDRSGGTTHKRISRGALGRLKVQIPPLREQHAIAKALLDVDALLATLDQMIAKKRDLKQAALQQLLTGKTRLPGFSGEWVEKKLGEVADVIDPHPSHRAPSEVSNGIPFVGIGDLDEEGNIVGAKLRLVDASVLQEHAQRYNLSDGLIGLGRVASIGKVVALKKQADRYAISPTLGVIYGRQVPRGFLLYSLKSQFVTEQFTKIMSGSTRSSVGMEVLRELKIAIPPSKEEQSAIADVLSSIDIELTALDARRDKSRNIKQAMMQELLTGKTRLVEPRGANA